jgi:hypothetical protein
MTLADIVAFDPVFDLMLLIFFGFVIAVIVLVAYFLLKRVSRKKMAAKRATAKNASR